MLLFYGGSQDYFIKLLNFDADRADTVEESINLAEKIEYVSIFAYILGIDCIAVGILWIMYVFKHSVFRGKFFKELLFGVDFVFDVFYAVFPIFIIGSNNLTFETGAAVANMRSTWSIIASLVPMVYVTFRLNAILGSLSKLARKEFVYSFHLKRYSIERENQNRVAKQKIIKPIARSKTIELITPTSRHAIFLPQTSTMSQTMSQTVSQMSPEINTRYNNDDGLFKSNVGYVALVADETPFEDVNCCSMPLIICFSGDEFIVELEKSSPLQYHNDKELYIIQMVRKGCISLFSIASIIFGIYLIVNMLLLGINIDICQQYHNEMNPEYPHLLAWPQCEYKVYPVHDELPCQCRNLLISYDTTKEWVNDKKLTPNEFSQVFESILKNFYMLETFEFVSHSLGSSRKNLSLTDDMMVAKNLKILYLGTMQFDSISSKFGKKWSNLEVLIFTNVHCNNVMVLNSWINLHKLQWLEADYSRFAWDNRTDAEFLCQFKNIRLMGISGLDDYISFPQCVAHLEQLLYVRVANAYDFDIGILLNPTLIGIAALRNKLDVNKVENRLLSLNEIHNNMEIMYEKEVFFQESLICTLINGNETKFETNYPLTYKLMEKTNGCFQPCLNGISSITCRPNRWHDGMYCMHCMHSTHCVSA